MKIDIAGVSIDVSKLLKSAGVQMGPGILQGALLYRVKKYSAKQLYDLAMSHKDEDLWRQIPQDWQENIAIAHRESGILNKVNVEWLAESLKKDRPELASLILNSKEVRAFLRKQLASIKRHAEKFEAG